MKKRLLWLLLLSVTFIFVIGCNQKVVQPDTPENALMLLKHAIDFNSYEQFQSYFTDTRKGVFTKDAFNALAEISTSSAELRNYGFLRFENGEVLLVDLVRDKEKMYKVQDI